MKQNDMSFNIAAEGSVLHYPAKIMLGKRGGELVFCGTLQWCGEKLSDSLEVIGDGMSDQFSAYVDDLLPKRLPGELRVYYEKNLLELGFQESSLYFKLAKAEDGTALLFAFQIQNDPSAGQDPSALRKALETVAGFFGIREFLFYAQTGNTWMLPRLASDSAGVKQVPAEIRKCSFLTYSHIVMEGDSIFVKAVRTLFGLRETELFLGAGRQQFLCMICIPSFQTDFMQSSDMYMLMELGSSPAFIIKGTFSFSFMPDMKFTVDCGVRENSFVLEAFSHVEKPLPLFSIFSIGDTCLMIRVTTGLTFGMYTNLYIRKIQLFGAVILRVQGSVVVPDLLSAAVSDLSIPILMDNLLGYHLDGIDVMDFIQLKGLPFQSLSPFSQEMVKNRDLEGIVSRFNTEVKNTSLQLDASQVQITAFGDGVDVTDLKRMRHYYIDASGRLKLMAQFYYATENTKLGNYTVDRGIFICAVIEIFGKAFEVLFSFREGEGLLAYARVPEIDLGFLKIGASEFSRSSESTLPVAKDSVITQFVNPQSDGMIFFLSADKKDVSFYFDGMVEFLKCFRVDARIIFCKGMISLDLRTIWLGIFGITLQIRVAYQSFRSGQFAFCLVVDTSPLTEKMTTVTRNIDQAVQRLRNKINDATREIDRAQAHVNELYSEIARFDQKIEECRQAIRNASWWKRAFVAIGKGIEIGAYEVAKVGIYSAIGVATAALQVAKKTVELSGKVGEGVLKAVKGVIQGAMSLFYLNYIRLSARADASLQGGSADFEAEIGFVALGKTYQLSQRISIGELEKSNAKVFDQCINKRLEGDLNNIENGSFRSNWQRYRHENYTTMQHCKRLDQAKEHLNSSVAMMTRMQDIYLNEFQSPMEEFDEMNVSVMDALDQAGNTLDTGARAGDVSQLANAMGGLKRSVAYQEKKGVFRDEELAETKELIAQYDEARLLYDKVVSGTNTVQKQRKKLEKYHEASREETRKSCGECVVNGSEGDMAGVLAQVEEEMYESFPVDRSGAVFINLSREPVIQESFAKAEKELGATPSAKVQAMRNRSRKGSYERRL